MPYTPTVWTDESLASTPPKYEIIGDVEGEISASAEINLVTSVTPGTPLNATNLNKIENGIQTAQATAESAIPKSLVTTAGDLIYATASAVLARLGIGAARKVLRVNLAGTAPEWGGAILARVARVAVQSIPNTIETLVTFDTESHDTDGFYNPDNPTYVTIPYTGFYRLTAMQLWEVGAGNLRQMKIAVYNSPSTIYAQSSFYSASFVAASTMTTVEYLSAGSRISLYAYCGTGGPNLNLTAKFSVEWIGA